MTPSSQLSRTDLEKLSAYLDGVLPTGETAALEARLAAEADLRLALEDLRFVARSLRNLPVVPVPRNFTLDRESVPVRRGHPYPALPFATALATLAFLVVFGWDAWAPRAALLGAQAPASEVQQEGRALHTEAAEVQALEMPAAAGEPGTQPAMPDEAYRFAAPEPTPCPGCPAFPPVTPDGQGEVQRQATRSAASETPTPTNTPTPTVTLQAAERTPPGAGPGLLDAMKIGLGLLAGGLAGATIWLRRK